MIQLITPTPNIPCKPGWCLQYVRETYGIKTPVYPSATANWNACKYKHLDKNFPNVAVPIWFSLKNEPAGHVALRMSDGSVYSASSATSTTPVHHSSLDALIQYYANANPLTYLGWSEDIENVRIAKEEEVKATQSQVYYLRLGIYGQNTPVAANDPDIGQDYAKLTESYLDYANKNGFNYYAYKVETQKQIADLKAQSSGEYIKVTDLYIKKG